MRLHRCFQGICGVVPLLLAGSQFASCTTTDDADVDAGRDAVDAETVGDLPADPGADLPADPGAEVPSCTSDCGAMVTVAGGPFQMGCVAGAAGADCAADEKPTHEVNVPAFEIDVNEITVSLYTRCVQAGGCTAPNTSSTLCTYGRAGMDQHPVTCIFHRQAEAFCLWAGKRMCSEAEWEKAAVGTDGRKYPWGDAAPTCSLAVLDEGDFGCGTVETFPVGSKAAGVSPYGGMDMIGNVWEWVEDYYHETYAGAPADGSAWMVPVTEFQVARGGALSDKPDVVRGSGRRKFNLKLDGYYLGARCCRSVVQ